MDRRLLTATPMVENKCDPIEVPIDLCCRKTNWGDEEPVQLLRAKRPLYRLPTLDVEVSLFSESCFYAGLNADTSQAGLFVATYRSIRRGEKLLLRFELFGERLEIEGEVQWRRSASEHGAPGVGVAFDNLPPNARMLIDVFCAKRAPLYYEVENSDSALS
jgi:Tfp pilus assembly protein PilZ